MVPSPNQSFELPQNEPHVQSDAPCTWTEKPNWRCFSVGLPKEQSCKVQELVAAILSRTHILCANKPSSEQLRHCGGGCRPPRQTLITLFPRAWKVATKCPSRVQSEKKLRNLLVGEKFDIFYRKKGTASREMGAPFSKLATLESRADCPSCRHSGDPLNRTLAKFVLSRSKLINHSGGPSGVKPRRIAQGTISTW